MAGSVLALLALYFVPAVGSLKFRDDGSFTILQVPDMHIANGPRTDCVDLAGAQRKHPCSDLNTTAFVARAIGDVEPDLIVYTGDSIFFNESNDVLHSLMIAFAPAIEAGIPWVATLGNHDEDGAPQERRAAMMRGIARLPGFAARLGPSEMHNGAGTFALHVDPPPIPPGNAASTGASGLTLLLLDSGGYDMDLDDWDYLRADQLRWLEGATADARRRQAGRPPPAALAFFHIPIPQYAELLRARVNISGENQQPVSCSGHDAGAFNAIESARDVKAVFVGHDHVNDYCGLWRGVQLCYGGGGGYHGYGKAGWARRLRVIRAHAHGGKVESWKVLDMSGRASAAELRRPSPLEPPLSPNASRAGLTTPIDCEVLWRAQSDTGDDCAGLPRARRHPPADLPVAQPPTSAEFLRRSGEA
jgi:3',5'-cyclic AMP phosphodiesterase CpdA